MTDNNNENNDFDRDNQHTQERRERQGRPRVDLDAGAVETRDEVDRLVRALNRPGAHRKVFQFGGRCAVVTEDKSTVLRTKRGNKPIKRAVPRQANRGLLAGPIETVSAWSKYDGRSGGRAVRPVPPWAFQTLIDIYGEGLLPLAGIADFPVLGADNKILSGHEDTAGYDPETCLYVACEPVDTSLHKFDGPREAFDFLTNDWLGEFNFATPEDRARALAIPLSILQRRTKISGGCPVPFITAPVPETGKTMLAQCLCEAVTGQPTPVSGWDHESDAERRKMLLAIAMENPPAVLFDNIANGWAIRDATLDKYITSDFFKDRLLGKNESATAPATTLPIFNGNNIIAGTPDLESRSYEIRMEKPAKRKKFKRRDPLEWTRKNRNKIFSALLTIATHKAPAPCIPESRFPDFGEFVGGPLQYAADNKKLFPMWEADVSSSVNEELEALMKAMAGDETTEAGKKRALINEYGYLPGEMSEMFPALIRDLNTKLTEQWLKEVPSPGGFTEIVGRIPPKQVYGLLRKYDGQMAETLRFRVERKGNRNDRSRFAFHYRAVAEE